MVTMPSVFAAMTVNSVLLSVTQDRLHFWQFQLQAAFRDGDRERAATCEHIVAEYGRLIAEFMKHLRESTQAGELAAPITMSQGSTGHKVESWCMAPRD